MMIHVNVNKGGDGDGLDERKAVMPLRLPASAGHEGWVRAFPGACEALVPPRNSSDVWGRQSVFSCTPEPQGLVSDSQHRRVEDGSCRSSLFCCVQITS